MGITIQDCAGDRCSKLTGKENKSRPDQEGTTKDSLESMTTILDCTFLDRGYLNENLS